MKNDSVGTVLIPAAGNGTRALSSTFGVPKICHLYDNTPNFGHYVKAFPACKIFVSLKEEFTEASVVLSSHPSIHATCNGTGLGYLKDLKLLLNLASPQGPIICGLDDSVPVMDHDSVGAQIFHSINFRDCSFGVKPRDKVVDNCVVRVTSGRYIVYPGPVSFVDAKSDFRVSGYVAFKDKDVLLRTLEHAMNKDGDFGDLASLVNSASDLSLSTASVALVGWRSRGDITRM